MPFRVQRAASVRAEASPYLPTMWGMPSGRACHCESRPAGQDGAKQSRGRRRDRVVAALLAMTACAERVVHRDRCRRGATG